MELIRNALDRAGITGAAARKAKLQGPLSTTPRTESAEQPRENAHRATEKTEPYRTWTDRSGRFRVEARIVSVMGPRVRIERKDTGKAITTDRDKLSEEDQEYVSDFLRRRSAFR
jgi:hypothetical protein